MILRRPREDTVDALHYLTRESRHDVQREQVLLKLTRTTCPEDHRRHRRVLGAPRDRQLRCRGAQLPGNRFELANLAIPLSVLEPGAQPPVIRQRRPAPRWDTVAVLTSQETRRQWTPRRYSQANVTVKDGVFAFDPGTFEQVVFRLLDAWFAQLAGIGDFPGGAQLVSRPFRRPPIVRFAGRDDVGHGPAGFLEGSMRIGPVTIQNIDEWGSKPFEGFVDCQHQILATEIGRAHV